MQEIRARGAALLAISADSPFSHAAFAKARGFAFPLLSDIHRSVIRAYDVLDEERNVAYRSTFVIDRDGVIRHRFESQVRIGRHVDDALSLVKKLENGHAR